VTLNCDLTVTLDNYWTSCCAQIIHRFTEKLLNRIGEGDVNDNGKSNDVIDDEDDNNNKYVHLRGRPYIHACRSYVHTPRDIDRHAITEALPTLNFTSGWVANSSDFGLLGSKVPQNGRFPA